MNLICKEYRDLLCDKALEHTWLTGLHTYQMELNFFLLDGGPLSLALALDLNSGCLRFRVFWSLADRVLPSWMSVENHEDMNMTSVWRAELCNA